MIFYVLSHCNNSSGFKILLHSTFAGLLSFRVFVLIPLATVRVLRYTLLPSSILPITTAE